MLVRRNRLRLATLSVRSVMLSSFVLAGVTLLAAPGYANSCHALAAELVRTVDGLTSGRAISSVIYLEHPQFRRASLGCPSRSRANDIFAESLAAKPSPEFYDAVAGAGAVIFSVPLKDVRNGAMRCARMSARRFGREISTRYRRLSITCANRRTAMHVTVSREPN